MWGIRSLKYFPVQFWWNLKTLGCIVQGRVLEWHNKSLFCIWSICVKYSGYIQLPWWGRYFDLLKVRREHAFSQMLGQKIHVSLLSWKILSQQYFIFSLLFCFLLLIDKTCFFIFFNLLLLLSLLPKNNPSLCFMHRLNDWKFKRL